MFYKKSILLLISIFLFLSCANSPAGNSGHTEKDRIALYEYLVEKIHEREAFAPGKFEKLGFDFDKYTEALKEDFIRSHSDLELFRSLLKLSNSRKDGHLKIRPIGDYALHLRSIKDAFFAPLEFSPDFSGKKIIFFVSAVADNFTFRKNKQPRVGDVLLRINDMAVSDFAEQLEPYVRYSSSNNKLWKIAYMLSYKEAILPEGIMGSGITYTLASRDGGNYTLTLPYKKSWQWIRPANRSFPDFNKLKEFSCFALYSCEAEQVLLLDVKEFGIRIQDDSEELVQYALQHDLLTYDLIVDTTRSQGGGRCADLVQKITDKEFTATMCNLKLSDIFPEFKKIYPGVTRLGQWLNDDATPLWESGVEYSKTVPFRLEHLPADADGVLQPSQPHFAGNLVCLFSSLAGSQVDQFAAIIIDNKLGFSIGMPTAGFSNSWEWEEDVVFPTTHQKVVNFMWSIGQTIRPNGEVLEGNPPVPDKIIPLTKDNFSTYYNDLLTAAREYLKQKG